MVPGGWYYWKTLCFCLLQAGMCPPPKFIWRVLTSRTLFGTRVFTEVLTLSEVLRGPLVLYDWCPYRKGIMAPGAPRGHRERPAVNRPRRDASGGPSAGWGDGESCCFSPPAPTVVLLRPAALPLLGPCFLPRLCWAHPQVRELWGPVFLIAHFTGGRRAGRPWPGAPAVP